jgi:HEAT repeat protein
MATPARRRQLAVLTVFTDLLKDTDVDLRLTAAEALGRLGDARGRSPLMTALMDVEKAVRLAAAHALADLGVERRRPIHLQRAHESRITFCWWMIVLISPNCSRRIW